MIRARNDVKSRFLSYGSIQLIACGSSCRRHNHRFIPTLDSAQLRHDLWRNGTRFSSCWDTCRFRKPSVTSELARQLVFVPAGMQHSTFEQPLPETFSGAAATAHVNGKPVKAAIAGTPKWPGCIPAHRTRSHRHGECRRSASSRPGHFELLARYGARFDLPNKDGVTAAEIMSRKRDARCSALVSSMERSAAV